MEINAGEIVENAVRRQKVNISELSRSLNVNRQTLYNWFRQKELRTDTIGKIGKAINYDFSNDFEESYGDLEFRQNVQPTALRSHDEAPDSVYYWMEKYIDFLEQYKKLLIKVPMLLIYMNLSNIME